MAEFAHDTVVPYKDSSLEKKDQVAEMFNDISVKYDFLNRFLSAGTDIRWRKKALKELKEINPEVLLDVATGTADVAIMAEKILSPKKIIGIDISEGMLAVGRNKIQKMHLDNCIELLSGDSEDIHFPDNTFDAVTVAFGVRNFQSLEKGLTEIRRVLKTGGKMVVLEFSKPKWTLIKPFYNFYMKKITPNIGKIFSKNKEAYQYLDESIKKFPEGEAFIKILNEVGYQKTYRKPLSLGICSIYCGTK
jgi:demethylmenaquinone methyltransferase/2-methoxy-6-polyprenyl-1,4-benzoquinol methylase